MRIDIHAHQIDRQFYAELERLPGIRVRDPGDGRQELRRGSATYMWSRQEWFAHEHCLRDMDAKAIDIRILSLSAPNVHAFEAARQPDLAQTFNDTLRMFRRYYDQQHPLPFLMIETWNDYEEGTAIERGVDTCK